MDGPNAQMGNAMQPGIGVNPIQAIIAMLAGAGFKDVTKGVSDLASSGTDLQALMSLPSMPLVFAGAGLKDSANSLELVQPLIKMLMPPAPPPPPNPQEINAAMQMMSARLQPGMQGLALPPSGGMVPPMGVTSPRMNQSGY